MRTRHALGALALTMSMLAAPAGAQVAGKPPEPPLAKVMPIAVGALAGGATAFFVLPLIVPSMASGAATIGPAVGTPAIGALGAAIGATIGYLWVR